MADVEETITIVGNVGQDPVRKATSSGEVVEFSVAHDERARDGAGTWTTVSTTWYRVSAWARLGDNVEASVRRGERVIVTGQHRFREWTGQDGLARASHDLKAAAVGHDLTRGTTRLHRAGAPAADSTGGAAATSIAPMPAATAAPPAPVLVAAVAPPVDWSSSLAGEGDETPF